MVQWLRDEVGKVHTAVLVYSNFLQWLKIICVVLPCCLLQTVKACN